jgi:hypothetical protein
LLAHLFERFKERRRQRQRMTRAAVGLNRRARPVCRQLEEGRRARQLLTPVGELRVEDVGLEPLALPDGEVRVLDWEFRQRRLVTVRDVRIEGDQFAYKDAG